MIRRYKLLFFLVFVSLSLISGAQVKGFEKIKWEKEKIAPGLKWKHSHTMLNDTVPQNINILVVNLHKRRISIAYSPLENRLTSKQAETAGALAAINSGFFNVKNGGSVTYIKTGGRIVDSDTALKWPKNQNLNGAILIHDGKEARIIRTTTNQWFDTHTEFNDIRVTGPVLVEDNALAVLPNTSLVINRHPRSAAGLRNGKKVILLTLDGRTGEAAGMTLTELASFMKLMHCRDAINLDGGGSTTMWIGGKPFNGVVNMPCDNKKFDHEGERAVSDILVIK